MKTASAVEKMKNSRKNEKIPEYSHTDIDRQTQERHTETERDIAEAHYHNTSSREERKKEERERSTECVNYRISR